MRWNDSDCRDTEARDANDRRLESSTRLMAVEQTVPLEPTNAKLLRRIRLAGPSPRPEAEASFLDRQGTVALTPTTEVVGSERFVEGTIPFGVPLA